jgi:hypothetical protein
MVAARRTPRAARLRSPILRGLRRGAMLPELEAGDGHSGGATSPEHRCRRPRTGLEVLRGSPTSSSPSAAAARWTWRSCCAPTRPPRRRRPPRSEAGDRVEQRDPHARPRPRPPAARAARPPTSPWSTSGTTSTRSPGRRCCPTGWCSTPSSPAAVTPYQRATSGIDAVCQAIESLWATGATDDSREIARRGLALAAHAPRGPSCTEPAPSRPRRACAWQPPRRPRDQRLQDHGRPRAVLRTHEAPRDQPRACRGLDTGAGCDT